MPTQFSRRSLFRALAPRAPSREASRAARISAACLETKAVACRRCVEICDADAIAFAPLGSGRAAPLVHIERCTGCGACQTTCPVGAIGLAPRDRLAVANAFADHAQRAEVAR